MAAREPAHVALERCKARLLEALRKGNYRKVAYTLSGTTHDQFSSWMRRGESGEEPFASFRSEVRAAEAEAEANALEVVINAAFIDAKHAEWFLSRRFPDRWAERRQSSLELRGDKDAPIHLVASRDAERANRALMEATVEELKILYRVAVRTELASGDGDREELGAYGDGEKPGLPGEASPGGQEDGGGQGGEATAKADATGEGENP